MIGHSCSMSFWTSNKIAGQRSGTSCFKKKLKEFVWFVYFTELCTFVSLRQKLNTEMSSVKQEGSISAQKTRPDGGLFGFFLPLSALIAVVKSFDWSSNVWQIVVFVLPTDWSCAVLSLVSELSIPVPWGEIRGKAWGHGHPVLCLHGWADNCGSFNTLIPFLPKGNSPQTGQGWEKLSPVGCCSRG